MVNSSICSFSSSRDHPNGHHVLHSQILIGYRFHYFTFFTSKLDKKHPWDNSELDATHTLVTCQQSIIKRLHFSCSYSLHFTIHQQTSLLYNFCLSIKTLKTSLAMLPLGDFADVQYLNFNHSTMFQENWNVMPSNMQTIGGNITGLTSCQILPTLHEMNPQQSPSVSNNSSDEAEQRLYSIIDERKQRRMISNRESARRSRMRKQKHLDEMWSQVIRLRTENHSFLEKFNQMLDSHNDVVQENVKLKDEVSHLWKMITNLQRTSPETFLRDLEETPCSVDNAKEALSNNSSSSSVDLLK